MATRSRKAKQTRGSAPSVRPGTRAARPARGKSAGAPQLRKSGGSSSHRATAPRKPAATPAPSVTPATATVRGREKQARGSFAAALPASAPVAPAVVVARKGTVQSREANAHAGVKGAKPVAAATTPVPTASSSTSTRRSGHRSQLSQEYDALMPYVAVAKRHPPLSRDDEFALAAKSRAGDKKASGLLVNHNVAFVLSMCRRYAGKGCRLDDLVQEGMIGLLKAVEHFDPARGNRFSTYASWWIRAYVQKFLRDMRATVKPIVSSPGDQQFALPRDFSLDTPIGDDDDTTYLDRLESDAPGPEDSVLRSFRAGEIRDALLRAKRRIGGLGWDIVKQRLEEDQPRTLEEIGKDWGLSRERVRQVEKATRQFLSRYLEPFAA